MTTSVLVVICGALLVVCLLGAGYFLVVVPRRWREPLRQALDRLDRTDREDLEATDRLLSRVMDAGPRGRDLADARFARAFVRALLGAHDPDRYWGAASSVEAIAVARGHDGDTAYLAMWLQSRLDHHEQVIEIYQEHAELLAGRPGSRRIAAASHLHLAGAHWRRREMDGALHHFDRVRDMGELTDQIPKAAQNLHVLKGIQSTFDQRAEDARAAFRKGRERAEQRGTSTVEADLGLLACDWAEGTPRELGERLAGLSAELVRPAEGAGDSEAEYRKLLRPPVALLHLIVLLREWKGRPPGSGGPDGVQRQELERRVRAVRAADPELGDSHLIEGLLGYYFALHEGERETALTTLEEGMGTAKGILVPEVIELVEKERELGGQGGALARFLHLVSELLADPGVAAHHRTEYRRLRDRFALYADDGGAEAGLEPHRRPTAQDLGRRMSTLRHRIERLVYPRIRDLPDQDPAVRDFRQRLGELDEVATSYAEQAEVLQRTEHRMITATGEFLLPQEETEEESAAERTENADHP
ncbi:hypothetical protein [Streptomyces sp. NPDC059009]|uniref:hypothetical protein n=1 Tax=Streptomyces sp. NPDC059009 TaxID=3346694 RepID=UPI003687A89A